MLSPEEAATRAVVALGEALREDGLSTSVDAELTLLRALGEVDLRRPKPVYWAARACFLRAPEQIGAFDRAFARFWSGQLTRAGPERGVEHGESDPRMPGPQQGGDSLPQYRPDGRSGGPLGGRSGTAREELEIPSAGTTPGGLRREGPLAAYSPEEVLSAPGPVGFVRDELDAVRRLAEELRRAVPERRSRRLRPSRNGGRLDLRRTVRQSLRTDGELLLPAHLAPSRRPRRVLFLCDVSGSMERYSRALLASLGAAVRAGTKAEAFVFATQLTRLTRVASGHDVARALDDARRAVTDWSGGTRIGASLEEFHRRHGCLGLARGAIVIVVSDGWDRGDPELLARGLARLRLVCRRLVWLNPRPATVFGQPLAVGMRVALPFVDDFVPGHDPRAVARLAGLIAGLDGGRPARPQRSPASTVRRARTVIGSSTP